MSEPRLAHTVLVAPGATPSRCLLLLHGLLGRGGNWRAIARRFVEARPDWAAVLVDLRLHGDSPAMAPPHTVAAAAADLIALEAVLPGPVRGVVGHSFGGKVALAYLARRPAPLAQLFIVDSMPGARPGRSGSGATLDVLAWLDRLPPRLPSREDVVARAVSDGYEQSLGLWLAMNLVRDGDGLRWGIDLAAVRALLDDYFACDLWPLVEAPPGSVVIHQIVAARSGVFTPEDMVRLAAAAATGRVQVHVLDTGHNVHAEEPDAVLAILLAAIGRRPAVSLRRATAADGPAVREFVFAALRSFYLEPEPERLDKDVMNFGEKGPAVDELVALCEGEVVGSVAVSPHDPGVGWLSKLYVRADRRGLGIGKALHDAAVTAGRARGYQRLELHTRTVFRDAVALYEREGWLLTEHERPADDEGPDRYYTYVLTR